MLRVGLLKSYFLVKDFLGILLDWMHFQKWGSIIWFLLVILDPSWGDSIFRERISRLFAFLYIFYILYFDLAIYNISLIDLSDEGFEYW
jgi:hypothetical protein